MDMTTVENVFPIQCTRTSPDLHYFSGSVATLEDTKKKNYHNIITWHKHPIIKSNNVTR